MKERKQRPLWPILTAALIGLPVLYVASFGPAMWIVQQTPGDLFTTPLAAVYLPLGRLATDPGDSHIKRALVRYLRIFAHGPDGVEIYVPVDVGGAWLEIGRESKPAPTPDPRR